MTAAQMLRVIAEYHEKGDYQGFKKFVESLGFEDVLVLKGFAQELSGYCDSKLKNPF